MDNDKSVVWVIEFFNTWSAECRHVAPVFSTLADKFTLHNLKFAKVDVGKYPKEGEHFRLNTHPMSKQIPSISVFKGGVQINRRPAIGQNSRVILFVFNESGFDRSPNQFYILPYALAHIQIRHDQELCLLEMLETYRRKRDRREWTAAGNPRAPSMDVYLEWIVEGWEAVTADMIKESFKTCGITNSLDGSEDDLIHCFKEAGPVPEGRKLLEDARAGINDEPLRIEDEEIEVEEEAYDSDKTFEFDDMLDALTF
ncbi:thioredoxin domain-containing protein [Ditylenchus destructor]|nr:thioredoxin domain-containing protein [Ditylenchus destructor]